MKPNNSALLLLAFGAMTVLSGCVVEPARVHERREVIVRAPPAVIVEERGAAPGPAYVWIDGYWRWVDGRHVWVPGHWGPSRVGYVWVPHTWVRGEGGWYMREGYWKAVR